jgi:hypothetical protein
MYFHILLPATHPPPTTHPPGKPRKDYERSPKDWGSRLGGVRFGYRVQPPAADFPDGRPQPQDHTCKRRSHYRVGTSKRTDGESVCESCVSGYVVAKFCLKVSI